MCVSAWVVVKVDFGNNITSELKEEKKVNSLYSVCLCVGCGEGGESGDVTLRRFFVHVVLSSFCLSRSM